MSVQDVVGGFFKKNAQIQGVVGMVFKKDAQIQGVVGVVFKKHNESGALCFLLKKLSRKEATARRPSASHL